MLKKALIVDDSVTMQNMVSMSLKELGFEITVAGDGVQGLEKAKQAQFDVVITDVNMPNMDGIAMVKALRNIEGYKTIPVIVLTTESGDDLKQKGRDAGATGWIVKPFNPAAMKAIVNKLLGL